MHTSSEKVTCVIEKLTRKIILTSHHSCLKVFKVLLGYCRQVLQNKSVGFLGFVFIKNKKSWLLVLGVIHIIYDRAHKVNVEIHTQAVKAKFEWPALINKVKSIHLKSTSVQTEPNIHLKSTSCVWIYYKPRLSKNCRKNIILEVQKKLLKNTSFVDQ